MLTVLFYPQISNYTVELVIPTGIPTKKAMAEIKIHPVMAETKIRNIQYDLILHKPLCANYSSIHLGLLF